MFTSYTDTLTYLYENLPMYQRVGKIAFKKDLTNTLALCEALGNPEKEFKSIHIAGTNGKGSTSHMLASILQSSGYKTGLYTSPHLKDFTERIRLNGANVSQGFVMDFVNRIKPVIDTIQPSFFEITVAMAFDYFARMKVDIAVIEVGLGGRLDSTNVITPELSVITNIGWDHKDLLGDSLEKIAEEKAGIMKRAVPVMISERQNGLDSIFTDKASAVHAPIYFASDDYRVHLHPNGHAATFDIYKDQLPVFSGLPLPLQGIYQRKNVAGVMKAVEILRDKGWIISDQQVKDGLIQVVKQTNLKGRWQILNERPFTVCDTAHNIDGIREVVEQIKLQSYKTLHVVWGSVRDKDVLEILALMPADARYYFCQPGIPRAMDVDELTSIGLTLGLQGEAVPDVNGAINKARSNALPDDLIYIGGSTFVVAEIDNL